MTAKTDLRNLSLMIIAKTDLRNLSSMIIIKRIIIIYKYLYTSQNFEKIDDERKTFNENKRKYTVKPL